jgi:FkbM family methyltransferase
MLLDRAKNAVKSVSFLYYTLRPVVRHIRRRGGEDERLQLYCARLPDFVAEPVFVKVGANDGITGGPVSDALLANEKWKGLLIEPVPFIFDKLRKNFSDSQRYILEQVAIGAHPGKATFYYVDAKAIDAIPDLPFWYDQLGSFSRDHIVKHLDGVLTPFILECSVEVRPLAEVLKKNGIRDVHLLHIDAEGYDYEVLKTIDLSSAAPAAILLEHKNLSDSDRAELVQHLRRHRYSVDDCGGDLFAVHKKSPLSKLARDWAFRARG